MTNTVTRPVEFAALLSGVALGFADPTLGCLAHKHSLTQFATLGIFFISGETLVSCTLSTVFCCQHLYLFKVAGLKLQDREIGSVTQAWPLGLYGLV